MFVRLAFVSVGGVSGWVVDVLIWMVLVMWFLCLVVVCFC